MFELRIRKSIGSGTAHSLTIDVELAVDSGIIVLFGPSGAGKTTILRAIAGVINPDEGKIALDGATFFDSDRGICLSPQERRIGYVFQDSALFPHLSAQQNVAYGLRKPRTHGEDARVRELLCLLGIEGVARRYPAELSGGEQQRVALARALASDPRIMLLDEPLSAVDVATRSRLLKEIDTIQQNLQIPFVFVTHNHSEAARIGRFMVLLDNGKVIQSGPPLDILNAPASLAVAHAVGTENLFVGRIAGHERADGITTLDLDGCLLEAPFNALAEGTQVTLGVRSEDIIVAREHLNGTSARNVLAGTIKHLIADTGRSELVVDCGVDFKVSVTPATVRSMGLEPGMQVYLLIKARSIHLLL